MAHIVTIVGRPNVGKSTLLNKIVGGQDAIVDNTPGVTRDRYYAATEWCGHTFTMIDTGGYTYDQLDDINRKINEQVGIALKEATVILFVLDCKEGMTTEDHQLAKLLRQSTKPIILVANKADNPALSLNAQAFHQLGIKAPLFNVSATHGSGTGDLLDAIVAHFKTEEETNLPESIPKLAFIGRSNVGKSTFTNALLGHERSIVDARPHTTRTPNDSFYRLFNKELILVDTAGIARKKKVHSRSLELYSLMRSIRAIEVADICLVLIDATEGFTSQDRNILNLAYRKNKGVILLVNKWDLIPAEKRDVVAYRRMLQQKIAYASHTPILFTSGLHKKQIYQAIEKSLTVYEHIRKRIPTATLNKIIQKAIIQNPPPAAKGHFIKINYAVQLPGNYPLFSIFCNWPEEIPANYKSYLEKEMRAFISFQGAPITLLFKKK